MDTLSTQHYLTNMPQINLILLLLERIYMKVLITGTYGFIGSYLAEKFSANGIEVIGVVRNNNGKKNLNYDIINCDLSQGLSYNKPVDVIVHAAANSSNKNPNLGIYILDNVIATQKIIDYAYKYDVSKIVYLSTVSVYGDINCNILNERTPIINPSYYGLTKYISENLLRDAKYLNCVSLVLPGVLGYNHSNAWLFNVGKKMIKNEIIEIYNSNELFNNLVYISDLEIFIRKIIYNEFENFEKLFLGSKDCMKIIDICNFLKEMLNSKSHIRENKNNNKSFVISIEKALKKGYKPMEIKEILKLFSDDLKSIFFYN